MANLTPVDHDPFAGAASEPLRLTVTPQREPAFADAIASIESGGNYRAVGPMTRTGDRAFGKYQVMGANVGPWSKEVLGRELSPREFLADEKAQDAIFEAKFGDLVSRHGPEGAARAWFAGERGMSDPNRRDQLGTSVADYSRKFTGALGFAPEESSAQIRTEGQGSGPQLVPVDHDPFDATGMEPPSQAPRASREAEPKVGVGEAAARGVARGLTANFYDELRGLMEAGGLDPNDPASLSALVSGAYRYWTGDSGAQERYAAAKARESQASARADEDRPVASFLGQAAGAVALPVGGMLSAATMPAKMARSAAVGAGYGGVASAGEGDGAADRLARAASGAAIGGTVGAVAPPVLAGIEGAGRMIGNRVVEPVRNALRGQGGVEREAARRVVGALANDLDTPEAVARMQQVAAAGRSGMPVANVDLGGETTLALARSAADTSPAGRNALLNLTNERFEGQFGRVADWINKNFHYPNAEAQQRALDAARRAANDPAYRKAFASPNAQGMWDEGFEQMASAPVVQNAIRQAMVTARNRNAMEGFAPTQSPFTIDRATGALTLRTDANGNRVLPSLQFWNQVKINLDKMGSGEAKSFARVLREHLDDLVPEYKAARAGAKAFFDAEDALEAGKNFVRQNKDLAEARRHFMQLSPDEKKLFQDGFLSDFMEMLGNVADRRNILNKIDASPNARSKLEMVLGRDKWTELETRLRVEGIMDLARNEVQGNSKTARYLYQAGLAGGGGVGGIGTYNLDPQTAAAGVFLAIISQRGKKVDERIARRVAEMLASPDPKVLAHGIRIVAKDSRMLNALRKADTQISRLAGQQGGSVQTLQSPVSGRAEDQ